MGTTQPEAMMAHAVRNKGGIVILPLLALALAIFLPGTAAASTYYGQVSGVVLGTGGTPQMGATVKLVSENLSNALVPLLSETPERQSQVEAFSRLDEIMEIGAMAPADREGEIVLALAGRKEAVRTGATAKG